MLVPPDQ